MEEQKDPRRKKLLTVFGAWLIGIIIILIIFAINSKRIFSIIDETRFVENVFGNTGGGQNIAKTDQQSADKASESTPYNQVEIFTLTQTQPDLPADTAAEQQPGEQSTISGEDQNPPAVPAEQALTDVKLYFVVVDSDGTVSDKAKDLFKSSFKSGFGVAGAFIGAVVGCAILTPIIRDISAYFVQKRLEKNNPEMKEKPSKPYFEPTRIESVRYNRRPLTLKGYMAFTNKGNLKI